MVESEGIYLLNPHRWLKKKVVFVFVTPMAIVKECTAKLGGGATFPPGKVKNPPHLLLRPTRRGLRNPRLPPRPLLLFRVPLTPGDKHSFQRNPTSPPPASTAAVYHAYQFRNHSTLVFFLLLFLRSKQLTNEALIFLLFRLFILLPPRSSPVGNRTAHSL